MPTRARDSLFCAGWLAWTLLVLAHYYVQLWRAVAARSLPSPAIPAAVALLLVACTSVLIRAVAARSFTLAPCAQWSYQRRRALLLGASLLTVPWAASHERLLAALARISLPGFPWAGEAVGRSGAALIGATLVAAAACSSGALVLRALGFRASSRSEHVVFAAVTGVGVVSYGSLLLALTHVYRPMPVGVLVAVLILSGIVARRANNATVTYPRAAIPLSTATAVWAALAAVALGYALVGALAPEKEFDALWYHLQLPRVWLEAGRPVDVVHEYVSLYPLTWELVFGDAMVLGGAVAAKLLHFACLPALAVLVGLAVRRFVPGVPIAAAVAILATTPTLLWESTTAYVDLALALHSAAACYALARYAQSRERAWATVAALQFGLAAATKHLGLIVAAIALVLYLLSAGRSRGGLAARIRSVLFIALLAALVPLPWYVRAWFASGNPVFPEMFGLFGAFPPWRWDAATEQGLAGFKAHFGMGRSPGALLALPWNVTVHGALFAGSLGPLFLVLLPGLLRARPRTAAVRWLVYGVAAYAAVWASPISSFQMRFLMPIVAPLTLLATVAFQSTARAESNAAPRGRALALLLVAGLGILNLPPFVPWHEVDRRGWNGWLTHVVRSAPLRVLTGNESETTYLRREVASFGAWRWINTHLPNEARVLAFSGGDQFYASRYRISFDAAIARGAVWPSGQGAEAEAAVHLRRLAVTHVLFDRRELAGVNAGARSIASPEVQQACVPEYDDGRYWVCRLDYARLPAGRAAKPAKPY